MTKTYYELLGLLRTASCEDVKHAFRREIAKYHPDKVQHLGHEFEEIAASKAAVLTQAYKTLGDPDARAEYDARIGERAPEPVVSQPSPPSTRGPQSPSNDERPVREAAAAAASESNPVDAPASSHPAEQDGTANEVVRRATVLRFRRALEVEFGPQDPSNVTGFDVACAPSKSGLFAKYPPRVLGRVVPEVDAAVIAETWGLAARTASGRPRDICVFVIGPIVASPGELAAAIKKERAKPGAAGAKLVVIPVNSRSWHAHIPTDAPPVVKSLVERLKSA
jgi:hypothetical protein